MSQTIILKHSTVKDKLPSSAQYGEVFVNYHSENPFLATLNNQGQFEKFLSENKLNELYYNKSQVNDIIGNLDDYYKKNEVDTLLQGKSDTGHTHSYTALTDLPDLSIYLTEHQDISYLATKQELESYQSISGMSSYLTVSQAEQDFQPKGDYVVPSDLTDYALKSELPSTTGLASEEWVSNNFSSTAHTHSDLATKAELDDYLTIASASTTYATKSEIPDISDLATKSEIPDTSNFITSGFCEDRYQPKGTYVVPSDLNNYVTSGYAEETFAKKGDVPTDVYTKSETDTLLAGKASSSHTHDYSEIQNTPDIPKTWRGSLAQYNNLTEIDNDTLYIITDSSEQLVTSGDVESMISGYTNLTEVQTLLEGYSQTGHTHSYNDLTDKPTIPSAGYVQNIWVGSLSDYENLTIVDGNTLYCITDEQEQLVTRSYAMNTFATKAMMSDYLTVSAATEMFVEKEAEPLPAYQFVEYIDVSGNTPGIITDYYLTANSVIEFDSEPASANDNMTLYGVTDADWGGMTEGVYAKYGYNLYTYHGYTAESTVQDVQSGRHTFKAGYNYGGEAMAGCQVDDGEIQTCSENYQSWGGQNNLPLGLFGVWSIGSTWDDNLGMKFNGKFYGCKVYEDNTLMRDYVPCVETSTGKVGIFDTLGNSFYETTASASTTVTGSSSAVTATTEETTSGETSGTTSGETSGNTSGETTGQTAYTIDTSVYEVGDYIDLNRDTYDLNYLINGDSKFVLDIYLQAGQNYDEMFGIENGDCFKIGTGESEGSVGLIFGNSQTRNTQYYIENDGRYVFEMSSGGSVVNGSMVADWSQAGTVYGMTNSHCHLGGLWQVMVEDWGDGPMDMSSLRGEPYFRMYNFKIYEGNTLLRDYRPVKRLSDDAIGWFDVVNQTFMGRDENNSVGEGASLGYNE